jgi:hypothetical protein
MIEDTLKIIANGLGALESKDDFVSVAAYRPNHLFFHTRFGNAGYFDIKADDYGDIKLFRNKRAGSPDESPMFPEELPNYLNSLLDQAQAATAEFLATTSA